jgi:hypothetical protein
MSQTFPTLKPSQRQFTLGAFPTKVYRSLAGTTVKRSYGNKPSGFGLTLEFNNVDDAIVLQILNHYNVTNGGFSRFALPSSIFAGMSATLIAQAQAPYNIRWEYTSAPSVQSVYNGISTVSVELLGELDV